MKELHSIIREIFDHSQAVPFDNISFSSEVRKMCEQNRCGSFGKSWTCPPAIAPVDELKSQLSKFNTFLIVDKVYELESGYDWKGMVKGAKDFQERIRKLRTKIRSINPDFEFLALGAGACLLCETCSYQKNEPCRSPEQAVYSVEAYGMDAMKMMKDAGLKYYNGPNTVTYIGGVFFNA